MKKKVRMLLRVSSNQQLEADGDLSIQRQLVREYIEKNPDWEQDTKEYFEGSNSGYHNSVADRDVLQEALQDAEAGEYQVLVAYKDDRIGRRMWEMGPYIMALKNCGVDIYTVKDGRISPKSENDIMGQMMLAMRYGNAQKSSSDTGMRVKDSAQKMVQRGKFVGGTPPYGYKLELSGEISKHGRALHHLVIEPERAEVVKYIYELSLNKEYGSAKIAQILNCHEVYKKMAPKDYWKSGTVTSILTNPIYTGRTAYKRREKVNGKFKRLNSEKWIIASEPNQKLMVIDDDIWNKVQERRERRGSKYKKSLKNQDVTVIQCNSGELALIDVIYCGYCGSKMTNGSKYNYWTVKGTGERRTSKISIYKCQNAWQGIPHDKSKQYRADKIEPVVFEAIASYIGVLQENEDVFQQIEDNKNKEVLLKQGELKKEKQELEKIQNKISVMESHVPDAMTGDYPLNLKELMDIIRKHKDQVQQQKKVVLQKESELKNINVSTGDWEQLRKEIPSWQEVFLNSDTATKRVLVNKLIKRIEIKKDEIKVEFKINLNDFLPQPRITDDSGVPEQRL